ncbi:hypothetical protein DYB31_013378 [Aphanomyces astaci]|uniref:Uncharacterized protein n=1 Tax=Aphanomyces astaci TaxID=112090 RepID=A0A397EY70_APHAT|nr:hypothetical protein DYB31_013378 [Aphanomyces astaci]
MLPPGHALSAYRVADEVQEVPEASLARLRENAFIKLAAARDQLHREAAKTSATLRDNERARRNKKPNVKQFFFNLGDYTMGELLGVEYLSKRQVVSLQAHSIPIGQGSVNTTEESSIGDANVRCESVGLNL